MALIILAGGLSALVQIDFPFIQFLRATNLQFLDGLGRVGNQLGHGSTLVAISAMALLAGYIRNEHRFIRVGIQTLAAHAVAGLLTQVIKHSLGRPRPRLAHQDHWQIGPSFQTGLDAFPSGHSTASFAVAAVLARHFPRYVWIIYGTAGFVAFSRIIKGSHFPADACTGALLGYIVGYVLSRPLPCWRSSLMASLASGLPFFVASVGLFWIMVQKPSIEILYHVILAAGTVVVAVGYGIRIRAHYHPTHQIHETRQRLTTGSLLIAMGIALSTGSFFVTVLATLAAASWLLVRRHQSYLDTEKFHPITPEEVFQTPAQEVLIGIGILGLIGLIYHVRGLVPLI